MQYNIDSPEISIIKEIKDFITPLSEEEFHQLEQNILTHGCKDPLTVWKNGKDRILIDGHNRYKICKRHNIDYKVEVVKFDSLDQVQVWMVNNQIGRRNLTADQLSYYRGKKYLLFKKSHGGYRKVENKETKNSPTSKILSDEFKVGQSTIKRDAKFAEGLEIISTTNPELKNAILMGVTSLKKGDIMLISEMDNEEKKQLEIKNEADLLNKLSSFRKRNIEAIESKLKEIESAKHADAKAELQSRDPMFLNQEERLERLKARILSAINNAIRNKNILAIEELKELIEKLQKELSYGK